MKKILLLLALSICVLATAQIPQGISYQAIAMNGTSAVASANVGVRLSILNLSDSGTAIYVETHTKMTNPQGLFNLVIGQGTPLSGTFGGINWGTGAKFLKVEMDIAGGSNYALVGTTQLLAVPYAMAAGSLVSSPTGSTLADQVNDAQFANFAFVDYSASKVFVFNSRNGSWSSQSYTPDSSPAVEERMGNFRFFDYMADKVYVFSARTGSWSNQSFTIGTSPTLIESGNNLAFVDYGANKVYAYNSNTGLWTSQNTSPGASPSIEGTNGNFSFVDYMANKVYIYNRVTGSWTNQLYTAGSSPQITETNGTLFFVDYFANKVYAFTPATGVWSSQAFTPEESPTVIISASE